MTVDRIGHRYGKLVVTKLLPEKKNGNFVYETVCDCGNTTNLWLFPEDSSKRKNSCGCTKRNRLPYGEANFKIVYRSYQQGAKIRGYDFDIGVDDFYNLITSDCYYCGEKPSNVKEAARTNGEFVYTGLDRVDSNLGYDISNVVPCCTRCNRAKLCMSQEEFFSWIDKVHANIHSQGF